MVKLRNLLFSVIIIVVFIFITETILWLNGYDFNIFKDNFRLKICGELLGEYDENLFWRLKNVKPEFGKENQDKLKIMCLTDSVSVMYEGKGYPNILQNILLNTISEKKPIVFNGGVPGYTSYQGLKYFKTELLPYNPDIITVCYGWNDHWQSGNKIPDKYQKPPRTNIYTKIINKSRIVRIIGSFIMKTRQVRYKHVGPAKFRRVSLRDFEQNIREFIKICKEEISVILMTAPYLEGPEEWIPTHEKYNSIIRYIASEEKIPLIDLVDKFKKRSDLFIDPSTDKTHYNWDGSYIVAKELAETIVK